MPLRPSALDADFEQDEPSSVPTLDQTGEWRSKLEKTVATPRPTERPRHVQAAFDTSVTDARRPSLQVLLTPAVPLEALSTVVWSDRLQLLPAKPTFIRTQRLCLGPRRFTEPVTVCVFEDEPSARASLVPLVQAAKLAIGPVDAVLGNWDVHMDLDQAEKLTLLDWQKACIAAANAAPEITVKPEEEEEVAGPARLPLTVVLLDLPNATTFDSLVSDLCALLPSKPASVTFSTADREALVEFADVDARSVGFQALKRVWMVKGRILRRGEGRRLRIKSGTSLLLGFRPVPDLHAATEESTLSWWGAGQHWTADDPVPDAPPLVDESDPIRASSAVRLLDAPARSTTESALDFVRRQCTRLELPCPELARRSGSSFYIFFKADVDDVVPTLASEGAYWDGAKVRFARCHQLPMRWDADRPVPTTTAPVGRASVVRRR